MEYRLLVNRHLIACIMASELYKNRVILVTSRFDQETEEWSVEIEISNQINPPDKFSTQEDAEDFAFTFAKNRIDQRPS